MTENPCLRSSFDAACRNESSSSTTKMVATQSGREASAVRDGFAGFVAEVVAAPGSNTLTVVP
jgi:hypothetical protein